VSPSAPITDRAGRATRPATGARRAVLGVALGLGAIAVVVAAACGGPQAVDRDQAAAKVLADSHGQLTAEQARCYVDRVIDEVGADQLQPDANPNPSQIGRLTAIRIDCIGVVNLGVPVPGTGTTVTEAPSGTSAHRVPQHFGDDPQLDALYRACQQGDGQSCDALFDAAPPGSDYEELAVTCGNRTREQRCADVYRGPSGTGGPATSATPGPRAR
jgi:hypothetical protein